MRLRFQHVLYIIHMNKQIGFIILRHVNNEVTNKYWIKCSFWKNNKKCVPFGVAGNPEIARDYLTDLPQLGGPTNTVMRPGVTLNIFKNFSFSASLLQKKVCCGGLVLLGRSLPC